MCELRGFLSGSLLQTHGWLFLASRQDTEILPTLYWAAATPVCSGTEAATHTKRASLDIYAYALLFRPCHLLWIIFLILLCWSIPIQFVSAAISAVIFPHFYLVHASSLPLYSVFIHHHYYRTGRYINIIDAVMKIKFSIVWDWST